MVHRYFSIITYNAVGRYLKQQRLIKIVDTSLVDLQTHSRISTIILNIIRFSSTHIYFESTVQRRALKAALAMTGGHDNLLGLLAKILPPPPSSRQKMDNLHTKRNSQKERQKG